MILVSKEKIKKWNSYRNRALKKNIPFTLSEDLFFIALHTQCYICGKNGENNELGLDRLNNESGYISGNIAPCCWECNRVKSNLKCKDCIDEVKKIVQNAMENTNRLAMPLIAKPEVAYNLKDGH